MSAALGTVADTATKRTAVMGACGAAKGEWRARRGLRQSGAVSERQNPNTT
jgi:hypothetical protein